MSAGGTPTFFTNHEVPEVTEVRAGTYIYGDRGCIANGTVPLEDCALNAGEVKPVVPRASVSHVGEGIDASARQVAEVYGVTVGEIERILRIT